jgi:hypothetical protein
MLWGVVGLVLLAALLVPLAAFVLDAMGRARRPVAPPRPEPDDPVEFLASRLRQVEDDLDDVAHGLADLREELHDLQRQIEARPTDRRPDRP